MLDGPPRAFVDPEVCDLVWHIVVYPFVHNPLDILQHVLKVVVGRRHPRGRHAVSAKEKSPAKKQRMASKDTEVDANQALAKPAWMSGAV